MSKITVELDKEDAEVVLANQQEIVELLRQILEELKIRAYKTALIQHHGIRDEAKYIINTWIGESKNG